MIVRCAVCGEFECDGCPPQDPFELAALIVSGQAFTDQDAIRVARALLDTRETA